MALALKDGKTVTARHARFPASFTVLEINPRGGFAKVDYNDGKGAEEMAAMNIDPRSIKISESVNENAKETAKEIFDELLDVNGEEIADMDKSECMTMLKMRGIKGGEAAMVCKELLKMTGSIGESLTEAKKFKPGDMWSSDFDYDGMLKYALKVNEKTPIKMLNKLFDSATDVNYHTPFRNLGIAIDWIEDGDKKGAKDYIKNFHDDIKAEMKSQGIK